MDNPPKRFCAIRIRGEWHHGNDRDTPAEKNVAGQTGDGFGIRDHGWKWISYAIRRQRERNAA